MALSRRRVWPSVCRHASKLCAERLQDKSLAIEPRAS